MPGARSVSWRSAGLRVEAEDTVPAANPGPEPMKARSLGDPELSPRPATMTVGVPSDCSRSSPRAAPRRRSASATAVRRS
ncbi:Uncharacterised protein [Mycobacteroides abscessus subsp. abscessus]|nr:Uncharacterised protein [Mycobacteroides abscessus subsp. abscessus]